MILCAGVLVTARDEQQRGQRAEEREVAKLLFYEAIHSSVSSLVVGPTSASMSSYFLIFMRGSRSENFSHCSRSSSTRALRSLAAHFSAPGAAAAQVLRGDAARWEVIPVAEAGPWAPVTPTGWIVRDTLSARIHPRRACEALEAALRARGVPIVREARDQGTVVWATGWRGLAEIANADGRPAGTGVKGQAVLLRHRAGEVAQIFSDGLHIIPHDDGTVAIGSTSERDFDAPDTTDDQADALIGKAVEALPILAGAEIVQRWAGVRPRSRSRAPMLGGWPGREGHFIANGGFKIGFGMAPMVAEVMADLILEDRDRVPESFRVEASL